jgi:AcrR family transcriptional regulator
MKQQAIREAALELASEIGIVNLTRPAVCERARVPEGSFCAIMGQPFTDFISELDLPAGTVKSSKHVPAALSKKHIIAAALVESEEQGHYKFTRRGVAERAGVSESLIQYYFGTMQKLRRSVMRAAVDQAVLPIVAMGLVMKDPHAVKAPDEVKRAAAAHIAL